MPDSVYDICLSGPRRYCCTCGCSITPNERRGSSFGHGGARGGGEMRNLSGRTEVCMYDFELPIRRKQPIQNGANIQQQCQPTYGAPSSYGYGKGTPPHAPAKTAFGWCQVKTGGACNCTSCHRSDAKDFQRRGLFRPPPPPLSPPPPPPRTAACTALDCSITLSCV